jgi:hypothetical protein
MGVEEVQVSFFMPPSFSPDSSAQCGDESVTFLEKGKLSNIPDMGTCSNRSLRFVNLSNFSVLMGYFLDPIRADKPPIPLRDRYFPSDALAIRRSGPTGLTPLTDCQLI